MTQAGAFVQQPIHPLEMWNCLLCGEWQQLTPGPPVSMTANPRGSYTAGGQTNQWGRIGTTLYGRQRSGFQVA